MNLNVVFREGIPGSAGALSCLLLALERHQSFFVKDFGFMNV